MQTGSKYQWLRKKTTDEAVVLGKRAIVHQHTSRHRTVKTEHGSACRSEMVFWELVKCAKNSHTVTYHASIRLGGLVCGYLKHSIKNFCWKIQQLTSLKKKKENWFDQPRLRRLSVNQEVHAHNNDCLCDLKDVSCNLAVWNQIYGSTITYFVSVNH